MQAARESRVFRPFAWTALAASILLGACASHHEADALKPTASIPAGEYEAAFRAAKDVLRASQFDLERVDAAAGVITTLPKSSAGLATPWLDYDATLGDGVDDLIHRDRRRTTVRFEPTDQPDASPLLDRRTLDAPLTMRVTVEVERTYVTGRRADPTSIRLTSRVIDPQLADMGLYPLARGIVGQDEQLASRIVLLIEDSIRPKEGSGGQNGG
jgi:hypothetical protein